MAIEVNTDQYIIVDNKFVFTSEGRSLIVNQTGGMKFAILGYMILENVSPTEDLDDYVDRMEDYAKTNSCSMMQAIIDDGGYFVMNDVNYKINGKNTLVAKSANEYNDAILGYTNHLFGTFYLPANEYQTNEKGERYGTYAFNFDRTYLNCSIYQDVSFSHIVLIGKQYAETSDATYDVSKLQDAGVVGIMRFAGTVDKDTGIYDGGLQILKNQNKYVSFQCQLKFTITETDHDDITNEVVQTTPAPDPRDSWPEYWNKRLALVNDGLKNISGGITIGQTQQVMDELELGSDGCIAMTKTLMVAEECLDADDAENQFNAAGLIHSINKFPIDGGEYTPQILLTTVHPTSALREDITAYSMGMTLKAEGNTPYYMNQDEAAGVAAPEFKMGHLPENDYVAVDIFGLDNKKNMYTKDRFIFSNGNSATQPANGMPNVIIDSDYNSFTYGGSNNNNTLIKSSNNVLTSYAKNSLLEASDNNKLEGATDTVLINSNNNTLSENANKNTLYSSKNNIIAGSDFVTLNATQTSGTDNANGFFIVNSDGTKALGNSYENSLYDSDFNTFSGTTTRSMLIYSDRNKLYDTTKNIVMVNTTDTVASGAYDDYILSNTHGFVKTTSKNDFADNLYCSAVSANQNNVTRSRYLGVKGLPLGSIRSVENPIISDVQSNNNIIMRGEYFDIYGSSNNLIMDTYFLQSSDDAASKGPVRIKGTSIVNSSKSKLYNAREMHLLNSEYSRIYVMNTRSNQDVGLNGCSYEMSQGVNDLYSIYYGEFYNTNNVYAYYGLKGTSYKYGAESIKDHCRPVDMLKLKTQFTNTYGSELNLAAFVPGYKPKFANPVVAGANYRDANKTLMTPSIKPTNTNVIGGHHNKILGGQNVTILGGEYCKASTYSHQVIMGKYNRDVPADLIYGCGHFNGTTYSQGNKEYTEDELTTIETMSGTIDGVRGDVNNTNGETCYNALEFYAHQGKLILRNCDDGHDRGTNVISENFGKTVEVSPAGLAWRDSAGTLTSELNIEALKANVEWTFVLECVDPTSSNPYFNVVTSIGTPASITNINSKTLANHLCKIVNISNATEGTTVFTGDEVTTANNALFNNVSIMPSKINVVFMSLPMNKSGGTGNANWQIFNKIYPWYTSVGKAPRYIKQNKVEVEYFNASGRASDGSSKMFNLAFKRSTLNANLTCIDMNSVIGRYQWMTAKCDGSTKASVKVVSFSTNTMYSDWIMEGMPAATTTSTTPAAGQITIVDDISQITETGKIYAL